MPRGIYRWQDPFAQLAQTPTPLKSKHLLLDDLNGAPHFHNGMAGATERSPTEKWLFPCQPAPWHALTTHERCRQRVKLGFDRRHPSATAITACRQMGRKRQ
jgi:hypothetical protein